jgi:hypothetical protein
MGIVSPATTADRPKSVPPRGPARTIAAPAGRPAGRPLGSLDRILIAGKVAPSKVAPTLAPTFIDHVEAVIGETWYNRLIKLPTKYMFAKDHPEAKPNPRITIDSAEFAQLEKTLKPGDLILCGNDDSFVHGIVYIGNGEIVHALAQDWPGRKRNAADFLFDGGAWLADRAPLPKSWREAVSMRFHALPRSTSDGIGVIHESLREYFARAHRDNFVVMRNSKLTAQDAETIRKYALAQVGKPYDYGFSTFDDTRMYCTEVVAKSAAQGSHPARIKGIYGGAGPIRREMFLNETIIASPDLEPVLKAKAYENTPFGRANPITIK